MSSTNILAGARRVAFRAERVTRIAATFGYFWAGGTALGYVILPWVARDAHDELDRIRRCQRFVKRATRHYHRVLERLSFGSVDLEAYEAVIGTEPCVIVANHPTLLDVTAFLAAHDQLCVVVKGELFRGRFVGALLRRCGHIDAGEGTELDGAAVLKAAQKRLEQGFSVLIFPEGTRSPIGGMHPFKRGAFDLATRAGVPLLPVFISCEPPAVAKGLPWWRMAPDVPFRLRLTPLSLMEWRPWEGRSREFRKHVQRLLHERRNAESRPECAEDSTVDAKQPASRRWNEI